MDEAPTNTVMFNVGRSPGDDRPEPSLAAVMIDGHAIHNVIAASMQFGVGQYTRVTIVLDCKVGGLAVEKIMKDRI